MAQEHINESILSEEILEDQKKNRIDHMTYLPGMEAIKSDVMDQVVTADLESQMQSMMDDNDYDLFLLIATNILNSDSELLVIGEPAEKVEAAFGKKLNENKRMNLPGVVSRKKQVVPPLTDAFEG